MKTKNKVGTLGTLETLKRKALAIQAKDKGGYSKEQYEAWIAYENALEAEAKANLEKQK